MIPISYSISLLNDHNRFPDLRAQNSPLPAVFVATPAIPPVYPYDEPTHLKKGAQGPITLSPFPVRGRIGRAPGGGLRCPPLEKKAEGGAGQGDRTIYGEVAIINSEGVQFNLKDEKKFLKKVV